MVARGRGDRVIESSSEGGSLSVSSDRQSTLQFLN
jgi:hypothetical protein